MTYSEKRNSYLDELREIMSDKEFTKLVDKLFDPGDEEEKTEEVDNDYGYEDYDEIAGNSK